MTHEVTALRSAAQQALEALETLVPTKGPSIYNSARDALRAALAQQDEATGKSFLQVAPVQEPVAHRVVAGALFDFMGWLTTRRERLVLSSTDDAAPAADAVKDFAEMRGLSMNDAQVKEWQHNVTAPPQRKPLTEEEIDNICRQAHGGADPQEWARNFARAIERAHGIGEQP